MSRASRLGLLLVLGVALLLRIAGLDRRELWYDERITAGVITGAALTDPIGVGATFTPADFWRGATPAAVLDASIRADAGNGVLYSLLLHGWSRVAGPSVGALRGFSVLFGLLTVVLVHRVALRFSSETGAWLAAGLAAVHPSLVRFSQEARSYSLATFLALAATALFLQIVSEEEDRPGGWAWIGYGAAAGGALLSHYLTFSVLLAHAAWALFFLRGRHRWRHCAAAGLLAGLLVLPWLLTGGREGAGLMRSLDEAYRARALRLDGGEAWAVPVTPRGLAAGWTQMSLALAGNRLQAAGLRLAVLLPLLGAAVSVAVRGGFRILESDRQRGMLLVGLGLAAPLLATVLALRSGHLISFGAHYAAFGIPFVVVLLAAGLEPRREGAALPLPRPVGWLPAALLGIVGIGSLGTVAADLPARRPPDPYGAAVTRAAPWVRSGDRVLYPSWAVARLCNLQLDRKAGWVQSVESPAGQLQVVSPEGRVRYSAAIPEH